MYLAFTMTYILQGTDYRDEMIMFKSMLILHNYLNLQVLTSFRFVRNITFIGLKSVSLNQSGVLDHQG